MNILLVTFSLRNPEKDYDPFFVTVRGNALNWLHFIEQTIIVSTPLDPQQLSEQLYPHLERSDSLLVARVSPHDFQGWLPAQVWSWLKEVSEKIEFEAQPSRPGLPLHPPR
jgi:hypothetical protein